MKNFKQYLEEKGLWDNIHAKRKRIANGSGERMRKPGSKGAPTKQNFVDAAESVTEGLTQTLRKVIPGYAKRGIDKKMDTGKFGRTDADKDANFHRYKKIQDKIKVRSVAENTKVEEMFDIIEDMVMELAQQHDVDPEVIWEDFESVDDEELLETAAWTRKAGKNPEGGLNRKGIESYRRENPGSKLSMAVTTKPSKLDPDSKAAKRRKSFCARMSGVDGPMKKPNGEPTRKALSLRKWNC